jgi:DNA-directed RNA polymerase subunit RPC12/RpoP
MWTKYDYVCTDCDALIEITTRQNIRQWRGWCPCGSANIINISVTDGNAPFFEPVTNITPSNVVKINTNPYN